MASHTLSPSVWSSFRDLADDLMKSVGRGSAAGYSPEDLQAERDLIKDAVLTNPEAFSSDLDIQLMMYIYSGR